MPPNPIVIPRKEPHRRNQVQETQRVDSHIGLAWVVASILVVAPLLATQTWALRWFYSGAVIQSLLIIYSSTRGHRKFPPVSTWLLLIIINLIYALASNFWSLYLWFTATCYSTILGTCIVEFKHVSALTRRTLRRILSPLLFTRDKIALFHLPGLKLDIGVDGLLVIRGLTISLLKLTVQAHGIELGFQLEDDKELALYVDEVEVQLLRRVHVGELYGALKTGNLRRESVAGDSTSAQAAFNDVTVSKDDEADKLYDQVRRNISASSRVFTSRKEIENAQKDKTSTSDQEVRSAICTTLQRFSSVPHAPSKTIKLSTLRDLIPHWLRRLIHRMPLIQRILLLPLSSLHPLIFSSISGSTSGDRLTPYLRHSTLEHYAESDPEFQHLRDRVYHWLAEADVCLDFANIDGLAQIPLRKSMDIIAWLRCGVMSACRVSDSAGVETAVQLGGADATFVVPLFVLPHHGHIVPALEVGRARYDGEDEGEVEMVIHGSLPAYMDQSLLDFASNLTKASRVFEMKVERESEEATQSTGSKLAGTARHPRQNVKAAVRKVMASDVVDDQWIAELMGKLAAQLERMQGEVGYSGKIPIALGPYRERADSPSKLLA